MDPTNNSSARLTSRILAPVRSNGYRVGNQLRRTDSVSTIDSLPSPGSQTPRCNNVNRLFLGLSSQDGGDELSLGLSPTSSPTKSIDLHSAGPPQYIIYLEPSKDTLLSQFFMEKAQETIKMYGPDSSHRYFPHCSLTSFFSIPTTCEGKENMGDNCSPVVVVDGKSDEGEIDMIFKDVLVEHFGCLNKFHLLSSNNGSVVPLATETGYVIAPISSKLLMNEVGMVVESLGKRLKTPVKLKHQWHVTLASGRNTIEQQLICAIYGNLESLLIGAEWDIVAYESPSSSLGTWDHKFREIYRMPVVAVGRKCND